MMLGEFVTFMGVIFLKGILKVLWLLEKGQNLVNTNEITSCIF